MIVKQSLSFYTNIPTPYQRSFFTALSEYFVLTVIFYSLTENNRSWQFDDDGNYKVVVLTDNFIAKLVQKKIVDFHFSWHIFKIAWQDKSQYIIVGGSYWIPDAAAALWIQHFKRKKIAYFSEPLFVTQNPFKYAVKWMMLRIVNVCCDALFCIGQKAEISFSQLGVTIPKYMIPYNINDRKFAEADLMEIARYKRKYAPDDEIIILSSGALIQRKGMDILIQAIKQISLVNIKLIIIGDGPERAALEQLAIGDKRIVFAGFQAEKDIPYFYKMADIFAFASRYDGWAVVINEAIAAGVPIICSKAVGAGTELIIDRKNGWLCESDNIEAFTEAIFTLVTHKNMRTNMIQEAKALIPRISSSYNAQYIYELFTYTI